MDDPSSTQSFPNNHHHRHRPSFHLTLPSHHSPEVGYPSTEPALDPLEQYGSRGEESTNSFLTSSTSSGGRRGSSGGFLNTTGGSLDGDANLGGHLDGESVLASHFADSWYGGIKKEEVWEDGESHESAADDFYRKGDCYGSANYVFLNCASEEGVKRKLRANYNNYVSCDAKGETVYNREADVSQFTKQTTSYSRTAAGSFSDSSIDYSRVSDNYLGREDDYGSSCGSGEDQLQPAEVDGPWLSVSPSSQTVEGRWRGAADAISFASGCLPQRSPMGVSSGTYTQKLDSFSEAFLSQRKRRFPLIPSGDSSGQMWDFGVGRGESPGSVKSRQSCAFDSDSYLPPSSPAHPSLQSFPSPPTSSHIVSSVLSPPPTPLPSHSPSKMDSSSAYGGTGHSASQGGESLGTLQFFASHLQSLPSIHSSGMIWKFPLLSHSFPQSSGDPGVVKGNLRPSHGSDYGHIPASHVQTPEAAFLASTSHPSSLHTSRALCPSNTPPLHPSFHLPSRPAHLSGQHYEAAEKIAPYVVNQKVKNGPSNLNQSQQQASPIYTGTPFPSILHSSRSQKRDRYTPQPQLNPVRRGKGLYSSVSSLNHREEEATCGEEEDQCVVLPYVNVGHDFQAELPPCFVAGEGSRVWPPEEESPREQLLWKPWDKLEESTNLQDQVEKLLSMCSSSCVPGGGSNTELTLHCLHYCQGNTMLILFGAIACLICLFSASSVPLSSFVQATLEMLLFSQPSPTGDYHYSGSDCWTDSEKSLFGAALGTYGKDVSLIQKMVRTKTVCQCVEFYYLSKKLQDKQKKQKEEEKREAVMEQQKNITAICQPVNRPFGLEGAVPAPSLASFFPCKLCGKMFYKIKSRNAHMKIHRQPQEDWTDRRLQHQLLTQRLALSRPTNLMPTPGSNLLPPQASALTFPSSGLAGASSNNTSADNVFNSVTNSNAITPSNASVLDPSALITYSNTAASNSHVITNIDGGGGGGGSSNQREPNTVLPFHQSWASFGLGPDSTIFYCNTEVKDNVAAGTVGGKETINWQ